MYSPVLDDAHHGPSQAHVDGLGHLPQKVLLDLEAALPNAPAAIHQEGDVHLAVCRTKQARLQNGLRERTGGEVTPFNEPDMKSITQQ